MDKPHPVKVMRSELHAIGFHDGSSSTVSTNVQPVLQHMREISQTLSDCRSIQYNSHVDNKNVDHLLTNCRRLQASADRDGLIKKRLSLTKHQAESWFHKGSYQIKIDAIDEMLNSEILEKLEIIKKGSLLAAEQIYESIVSESPYSYTIITDMSQQYELDARIRKVGFHEANVARNILFSRADYRQKQQQLERSRLAAQLAQTNQNEDVPAVAASSTSASHDQITANNCDLITTPAVVSQNLDSQIEQKIADALREIKIDPLADFDAYMIQAKPILDGLEKQGLFSMKSQPSRPYVFTKHFTKALVKRLNPVTQLKDIAYLSYKVAHWTLTESGRYILLDPSKMQELRNNIQKFFDAVSEFDPNALTAEQWGEFLGSLAGDGIFCGGAGKAISYLNEVGALAKVQGEITQLAERIDGAVVGALTEKPQVATAEGFIETATGEGLILRQYSDKLPVGEIVLIEDAKGILTAGQIKKVENALKSIAGGNKIKNLGKEVLDVGHIFSREHIRDGILKLGDAKDDIILEIIEIIKQADKSNLLQVGPNRILTKVNGHELEIRAFIRGETLVSCNAFMNYSSRPSSSVVTILR